MVLGLGKAKGIIEIAVIGLALAFAVPLATQIPRVYRGTVGLIEQVAGGIAGATEFVGGIGESVTTTICNYDFFNVNPLCKEEPTVEECYQGEFINGVCTVTVTPPPVVVPSTGDDVQCVNYRDPQGCGTHPYMNSQYESCLGVNVQDGKCTCQVSQQCVQDIDKQTCDSQTNTYWEFGQCKTTTTTESIDVVTGEKVQDILDEKFVDAGGDLQKCEDQGGIVIGNYFSSLQSDVVTTCVPKERQTVTTRYSLQQDCQGYCNRNNYDIGTIDIPSNTCVCDGVPQIHLTGLTGLSIQDIDKALEPPQTFTTDPIPQWY